MFIDAIIKHNVNYCLGQYVNRCYLEESGALGSCCIIDSDHTSTISSTIKSPVTNTKTRAAQSTTESTNSATTEYSSHSSNKVKIDGNCNWLISLLMDYSVILNIAILSRTEKYMMEELF